MEPDGVSRGNLPIEVVERGSRLALAATIEQARDYADHAKSDNTRRAYRADWNHFTPWPTPTT